MTIRPFRPLTALALSLSLLTGAARAEVANPYVLQVGYPGVARRTDGKENTRI